MMIRQHGSHVPCRRVCKQAARWQADADRARDLRPCDRAPAFAAVYGLTMSGYGRLLSARCQRSDAVHWYAVVEDSS